MDEFQTVLCLCPSSRLSLASLVLSTWSGVRRYVLTEEEPDAQALDGVDAVVVMDRFVTAEIVDRLAGLRPVIVLAWNGLFEIQRYQQTLGNTDVTFMGTDENLDGHDRYFPMINGQCVYETWRELYRHKRQFEAKGNASYRLRWARARVLGVRSVSVAIAAANAARRPHALRRTLQSGFLSDKLVWAGNCFLDLPSLGLTESEQAAIIARLEAVRERPTAHERLQAGLDLVAEWRQTSPSSPDGEHRRFYVTNTLLRWSVIGFLSETAKPATWFFGRDNLGLGLELELYVHNLVPTDHVAFLEFGGKTSRTAQYPRALHLLARQFYVIAIPPDGAGDVLAVVERIRHGLTERPHELFATLERRRQELYANLPSTATLHEVQQRVWRDFDSFAAS